VCDVRKNAERTNSGAINYGETKIALTYGYVNKTRLIPYENTLFLFYKNVEADPGEKPHRIFKDL